MAQGDNFGIGLVSATDTGNVIEENTIVGNTNGILLVGGVQGNVFRRNLGEGGKLGFTKKGEERAQGFEGCISTLKAMSIIAKVPADQRSATQRRRVEPFEEFGCTTCHKPGADQMGLTEVGTKLAHLHLGCVDMESS